MSMYRGKFLIGHMVVLLGGGGTIGDDSVQVYFLLDFYGLLPLVRGAFGGFNIPYDVEHFCFL